VSVAIPCRLSSVIAVAAGLGRNEIDLPPVAREQVMDIRLADGGPHRAVMDDIGSQAGHQDRAEGDRLLRLGAQVIGLEPPEGPRVANRTGLRASMPRSSACGEERLVISPVAFRTQGGQSTDEHRLRGPGARMRKVFTKGLHLIRRSPGLPGYPVP
jgi:hypothetical protein